MDMENLVSAKEAAKALGMSRDSLYRLSRAKRVPRYAAGPKLTGIRFSVAEVREALRRPVHSSQSTPTV